VHFLVIKHENVQCQCQCQRQFI